MKPITRNMPDRVKKALAVIVGIVVVISLCSIFNNMDIEIAKQEKQEQSAEYEDRLKAAEEDIAKLQAIVDELSESHNTLVKKIEFEQNGLPEQFYWQEDKQ